ncbi:MAG: hypothetical protein ACXW30_02885 [Micavibrio sp.]
MTSEDAIPDPVEGKFIFQLGNNIRARFNADGWVEEIGRGGPNDPLGTVLQGQAGSKLDDLFVRRYYDLHMRAVIIDVHPKKSTSPSGAAGLILFKDLEAGSTGYLRVNKIIAIANHHFNMGIKPLAA